LQPALTGLFFCGAESLLLACAFDMVRASLRRSYERKAERAERALDHFIEAHQLGEFIPNSEPRELYRIASLAQDLGKDEVAARHFQALVKQYPTSPMFYEANRVLAEISGLTPALPSIEPSEAAAAFAPNLKGFGAGYSFLQIGNMPVSKLIILILLVIVIPLCAILQLLPARRRARYRRTDSGLLRVLSVFLCHVPGNGC